MTRIQRVVPPLVAVVQCFILYLSFEWRDIQTAELLGLVLLLSRNITGSNPGLMTRNFGGFSSQCP
jgi:peptidoglycan/LPS O-acetylase OafA/YrhL